MPTLYPLAALRRAALLSAALLLGACAGLPTERGRTALAVDLAARGLDLPAPSKAAVDPTAAWLAEPLSVDRAIQIALIHNPELQAASARLGASAADVYEAGRLANPLLSATLLSRGEEPHAQLTLGLALNFTDLLLLGSRQRIADAEFERTRLAIGSTAIDLAADVEAACRRVAAAMQQAELADTLAQNARNAAALAQRYFDAGNVSRLQLALEQASAAQAALDADAARRDLALARGALQRLLGLPPAQGGWRLGAALTLPPPADEPLADLQALARRSRLDVASARRQVDAIAARYGLARRTRLLGDVELGAERDREYDGSVHVGPTLSLALPILDWGAGRVARGAAALQAAQAELAGRELDAVRDVDAAYTQLQTARTAIERYRRDLLPARETAVEQTQRRVNYMLGDVFELLAVRQQGFDAYHGYLNALRDYWVARAELARAVGSRLPLDDAVARPALSFDGRRPQPDSEVAAPAMPSNLPTPQMPQMPQMPLMHHDHAPADTATPPSGRAPTERDGDGDSAVMHDMPMEDMPMHDMPAPPAPPPHHHTPSPADAPGDDAEPATPADAHAHDSGAHHD